MSMAASRGLSHEGRRTWETLLLRLNDAVMRVVVDGQVIMNGTCEIVG